MLATQRRSTNAIKRGDRYAGALVAQRGGIAVVELAVVLPILLTVTFGTLEICNRLFLRQTAAVAAYEGARLAARRTITQAQVRDRCMAILQGGRVVGGQVVISCDGGNLATLPTSGQLSVQVVIPVSGNTPVSYVLPSNGNVQAAVVMLRE